MAYQGDDYTDLVTTTLRHLERETWADIVIDNQRHVAMPRLMKRDKITFDSGYGHQFNLRTSSNQAARNVKLNEEDNPTTADVMKTGNVPWRHTETHWALEERIIAMNRNPARLVSLLKTSRVDAMTDLAELMEMNFWEKPDSSSDEEKPFGIPYWIVKDASEGFNGGNATGFSDGPGNVDSSTVTRWKNWTNTYAEVSKTDLIRKMRKAAYKTDWRPPVKYPNSSTGNDYKFFTTYDTCALLEEVLESQNDNLGKDVAPYSVRDNMTKFHRADVEPVPYLDNNTSDDPVYGINFGTFKIVFLSGEYMKKTKVKPHPFRHRTLVEYTDCSYNFFTNNRRTHFVIYKV